MKTWLDHSTGEGRVHAHRGNYSDGLLKNNAVAPLIVETFGGIEPRLAKLLKSSSRTAADIQRGRDSTDCCAPSHLAFHTRRIASKAAFGDAKHIYDNITRIKALAFACASTAARATAGLPSPAHA